MLVAWHKNWLVEIHMMIAIRILNKTTMAKVSKDTWSGKEQFCSSTPDSHSMVPSHLIAMIVMFKLNTSFLLHWMVAKGENVPLFRHPWRSSSSASWQLAIPSQILMSLMHPPSILSLQCVGKSVLSHTSLCLCFLSCLL